MYNLNQFLKTVYLRIKKFRDARYYLSEAKKITEELGDNALTIKIRKIHGDLLLSEGELEHSFAEYNRCLELLEDNDLIIP